MNQTTMLLLAADRQRELRSEAARARLARSARREMLSPTLARPRTKRRFGLGQLLGRPSPELKPSQRAR